jgi:hypothetical protein
VVQCSIRIRSCVFSLSAKVHNFHPPNFLESAWKCAGAFTSTLPRPSKEFSRILKHLGAVWRTAGGMHPQGAGTSLGHHGMWGHARFHVLSTCGTGWAPLSEKTARRTPHAHFKTNCRNEPAGGRNSPPGLHHTQAALLRSTNASLAAIRVAACALAAAGKA